MPESWPKNHSETPQHLRESDVAAGFEITEDFERFNQMNDMFTRAFWDDRVKSADTDAFFASYRMEASPRRGEGFSQRDFALRNAAWLISDVISDRKADQGKREGFQAAIENDTPIAPEQAELGTPKEEADGIKRIARFFGADLVGIADIDERWHYTHRPDTYFDSLLPSSPDTPRKIFSLLLLTTYRESRKKPVDPL